MGLEYKVLIIDDSSIVYKDYKDTIEEYLTANGFLVNCENISNDEEFKEKENCLQEFDLILVDLMFGPTVKGNEFISKIRKNLFTDLLFYSSNAEELNKFKSDFFNQNIIFAEKDDQNDEVEELLSKLLDNMIRKYNQPISTRGIVIECVAELDDKVKQIISLLLKSYNDKYIENNSNRIDNVIFKYSKEAIDQTIKYAKDFFGIDIAKTLEKTELSSMPEKLEIDVIKYVEEIKLSNSFRNLKILKHIYKKLYGTNDTYQEISNYENLLFTRNILAHTTQYFTEKGIPYFKTVDGDYNLTTEECAFVRKSIVQLYAHFNLILENISDIS